MCRSRSDGNVALGWQPASAVGRSNGAKQSVAHGVMGTKTWRFLLPDSGSHVVRAEELGAPRLIVYIDGTPRKLAALTFSGPDGCMLELRRGKGNQWNLFVNGLQVEEYDPNRRRSGDETLRCMRSTPDGSYVICPDIPTDHLDLNVIRKFLFSLAKDEYEVEVAHDDCIWQVVCNGNVLERKSHTMQCKSDQIPFDVQVGEQRLRVPAIVSMTWQPEKMLWDYSLSVDNVDVPVYWTKMHGQVFASARVPTVIENEVVESAILAAMDPSAPPESCELDQCPSAQVDEVLPQGVSYDRSSGVYQATIRAKSGRFVLLGEFATPQEAHAAYLEAVPFYKPDFVLAPEAPI